MKRLGGIAGVACVASLGLGASSAHGATATNCGELPFSPDTTLSSSAYGAGDITALRTTCATARRVAGALEGRGGLRYRTRGFTCRGTATSSEPGARKNWRCLRVVIRGQRPNLRRVRQVVTFYSIGA